MLESDVVFLNHGSFGACPRPVFEEYQRIQCRLEAQPVRFLQRELQPLMAEARASLAGFLDVGAADLVFVTNPTYAVNAIARSLGLGRDDEIVTSNHEYGACRNVWQFAEQRSGCSVVEVPLDVTIGTDEQFVEQVFAGVTERTRLIFLSHITSATALTLPVAAVCSRACELGILTLIDGAHAPGQIDLAVRSVGADFYVGACHKWLCSPKGASFLIAGPEAQALLEPLVVGWGWGEHREFDLGSPFLDQHEWLGTHDPAAILSVPAAIEFQRRNDWQAVRADCHERAVGVLDVCTEIPGVERVHADERFVQMAILDLAASFLRGADVDDVQRRLRDDWRIEAPVSEWVDATQRVRRLLRVSIQAYNTDRDVEHLAQALRAMSRT
jgi:isopenicillin-N epimerase